MVSDTWPPYPHDVALAQYVEWDGWYRGDTTLLNQLYTGQLQQPTHTLRGQRYRGGLVGTLSKMFLGQPIDESERNHVMHLPVAADLAQLSADLLFSDAPKILLPGRDVVENGVTVSHPSPGQDRLDLIINSDRAHSEMLTLGEYAAALGGAYIAVTWDQQIEEHVFPRVYGADTAIPTFRHGRLVGVKLFTEYRPDPDGRAVYRLMEEQKPGSVTFTLYKGGEGFLGGIVPIEELEETAHYRRLDGPDMATLAAARTPEVSFGTGVPWLAVEYMPNITPNREWRRQGVLANFGRSDFDGVIEPMDKVDRLWSGLLDEFDLGQGRIIAGESLLESNGPGQGKQFKLDRKVYQGVNSLGAATATLKDQIVTVQHDIRHETYLDTIDALVRSILRDCGYSPSDFGDYTGGDKTATEVTDRRADSERTRDKKALHARPALAGFARTALAIDGIIFPGQGGGEFELPEIEFAPLSQEDPEKKARTIQALDAARAISIETKVRMAAEGRERSEVWIKEEIAAVREESTVSAEAFTPPDFGPPQNE